LYANNLNGLVVLFEGILIMPENLSQERRDAMVAYGAELILVSEATGMEGARDLADTMEKEGRGKQPNDECLQFLPRLRVVRQ
jgi:cysteine synthase